MASKVKLKRSDVTGKIPQTSDLEEGQIALNTTDGKVFMKKSDDSIREITKQIHDEDTSVSIDESGATGTIVMTADGTNVQEVTDAAANIRVPVVIEDSNSITIKEGDENSDGIEIKIPVNLSGSYDFVLPETPGVQGQVLRTDGEGNLDWVKLAPGTRTIQVAKSGDDANDGINAPVKTLKRATQIASELTFSPRVAPTQGYQDAIDLLLLNKEYLQAETIAYIEEQIATATSGSIWDGFTYNQSKCSRDVGYLVESAAYDLKYTGNSRSVFSAERYYSGSNSTIDGQEQQTAEALEYLQSLSSRVIQNDLTGTRYQSAVDQITDTNKDQGSAAVSDLEGLYQITIDALQLGENSIPAVVDPQYIVTSQTIQVSSGEYYEENPVLIPDFCSIVGDSLRNCILRPLNPLEDFLRVRDGVYFSQFTFRDALDPNGAPLNRFDYAVAFDDLDDRSFDRFEYPEIPFQKTLVTASPYIQNCSIISFLGANGIYNDGSKVRRPNIPPNQIEAENPPEGDIPEQNPSMVANAFTMLSFGGTGWRVTNEAYSQVVSCFQIFCKNGSYCQSGGYLSITNSATNFGLYALRSSGYRLNAFNFDRGVIATNGVEGAFTTFDVMGYDRRPVEHFVLRFRNSAGDDITDNFKTSVSTTEFTPDSSAIDAAQNTITITDHGFINGERIQYDANGNQEIPGLIDQTYYYVELLTTDTFRLYEDDSLTEVAPIEGVSTGTHLIIENNEEFYIAEVLDSSNRYQILQVSGSGLLFNVGQEITGSVGSDVTNAYVFSWDDSTNTLVVSLNEVDIGGVLQYIDFTDSSTITVDALGNTDIPVTSAVDKRDKFSATLKIQSSAGGSNVQNVAQTTGLQLYLHRPSIVNSSAHTWEYAGSGTDYNALPANGGQTVVEFEQFQDLPGRVYTSGTNELGDFKVGSFIVAENRTGNVTFANRVSIAQLDSISLSLSDVTISEISKDSALGDNDPGGANHTRLTTQLAQRTFMDNRLGDFLDKRVAASAVPGAVVQLNSSGQLNSDLIPATRAFNSFNLDSFEARLELVDDIPPQEVLAGDIVIEAYEQQSIVLNTPVTLAKGTKISQPSTGAEGFLKEDVTNATNLILVDVVDTFEDGISNPLEEDSGDSTPLDSDNDVVYPVSVGLKAEFQENFFLDNDTDSQFLIVSDPDDSTQHNFTIGDTVVAAGNKAQGTVTDYVEGVATLIDSDTIPSGSSYNTNGTYNDIPLDGGSGTGARADITVSSGEVTIVDLVRGGSGYVVGDVLTVNDDSLLGGRSGGEAFTVTLDETENRLYIDLAGNFVKFSASATNVDFLEDNNAPLLTIDNLAGFDSILFDGNAANGEIDYSNSYVIVPTPGHGLTDGDPLEYDNNGNATIGGLSQLDIFYAKVIDDFTFEVYSRYDLNPALKVNFTSSQAGTHIFRRRIVTLSANRLILDNHGFVTGDPVKVEGNDLPGGLTSGDFYYAGALTANSFTLHTAQSDAQQSINGVIQGEESLTTSTGTGPADFTVQNVEFIGTINTSSQNPDNYSSLSGSNIDADNIVSGIISPSRLATGAANSDTFLRGDSVWTEAVTTLRVDSGSALNLIGDSRTEGADTLYYGDIRLDLLPTDGEAGDVDYTNLGVSAFNKSQFTVSAQGQVDITSSADGGTLDAATLGGNPASFYINPENFNRAIPVNKGGTNLQSYTAGDILYAAADLSTNTDSLSRLSIGADNTILTAVGGEPVWSNEITINDITITGDFNASGVLFVDNIENAVGINDSSPSVTLDITGTDAIKVPAGTTSERPIGVEGYIRYNSTTSSFEGYTLGAWASLGGVKDVDQDTFIEAETAPGTDEDILYFYNGNALTTRLGADGFTVLDADDINLNDNIVSITAADTDLQLQANGTGVVFVNDDAQVTGTLRAQGTATLDQGAVVNDTQTAGGDLQVKGNTNTHLLFADASTERIGILQNQPKTAVHIKDFGLDSETTSLTSNSPQAIMSFATTEFRTAKLIVQVTNNETGEYQSEEILLIHNGATVEFVEYGIIYTSTDRLATFSAQVSGGSVLLEATGATQDSITYKVVKTVITD